jgi:Zn-dependent oligopeptidase
LKRSLWPKNVWNNLKQRKRFYQVYPDVVEVFDNDGKSMAIYYLDFYTRDNKMEVLG